MKRTFAAQAFLCVLFLVPLVAAILPLIAAASYASKYGLFNVPMASWFVFGLSGVILLLDGTAFYLWRRSRKQGQKLAVAIENLAGRDEHLPLVCGHAKLGQPEFPVLVQMLFKRFPDIECVHVTPLPGGYGGSMTVLARLQQARDEAMLPQPFVLKLGRKREMADECDKFDRYVRARLVNVPRFHSQCYAERGQAAAIAYEFAGLGGEVQNFYQFYRGSGILAASELVEEIYVPLHAAWYRHGQTSAFDLHHEYDLLSKKRDQIVGHVSKIVARDDPYRANLAAVKEDLRPNLRPVFCPPTDVPWCDPVTFLQMWSSRAATVPIHRSIVHGDLHTRNVLIEAKKGGFKQVWLIDFSHTGNGLSRARTDQAQREGLPIAPDSGHTLRDFSRLEADVKFILTRLDDEQDLGLAVAFEQELLAGGMALRDLHANPPRTGALTDARLKKAWHVIREIRRQAVPYLTGPDDLRPYYYSLLHATLPVVYYHQEQFESQACELQQKRYALLAAGMLCSNL
jgi:hypothetical protein